MKANPLIPLNTVVYYLLFSRIIRALLIDMTGSFTLGTIVSDAVFLGIYAIASFRLLMLGRVQAKRSPVTLLVTLLFCAALLQGIGFYFDTRSSGYNDFLIAFSNFRRYFMLLPFFFVLRRFVNLQVSTPSEGLRAIDKTFAKVLNTAIAFQLVEFVVRTVAPTIGDVLVRMLVAPLTNASVAGTVFDSIQNLHKSYFGGRISVLRIFGIGADYYVSGAIISVSYYYRLLVSQRVKILSLQNVTVAIALFLSGSLQFLLPFFIVNLYELIRDHRIKTDIKLVITSGAIILGWVFILPAFNRANGYFDFLVRLIPGFLANIGRFALGLGPLRINVLGTKNIGVSANTKVFSFFVVAKDFGFATFILEAGIILAFLFGVFIYLFFRRERASDCATAATLKRLRFALIVAVLAFTLHYPVLFAPVVFSYVLILMAIIDLYSREKIGERFAVGHPDSV